MDSGDLKKDLGWWILLCILIFTIVFVASFTLLSKFGSCSSVGDSICEMYNLAVGGMK